jgi:glycosyltransferase involved in cell wall biosynthesis
MRPRIGFVLEQALGHVAYGMSLRETLSARQDIECEWLEVNFDEGRFGRIPLVGKSYALRGNLRARSLIARTHRRRPLDALFVHTSMIGLLAMDYVRRIPTMLSLDATPLNFDQLAKWYGHKLHSPAIERGKLVHRALMRRARGITAWSRWTKDSLVNDYGVCADAVTVIHPGTNFANLPPIEARSRRRPGPARILFVGGDFPRKGGDLLVKMFRERLRGSCELHLVIGADLPEEEGVHVYRGVKPHSPKLLQLYTEADIFCLPTRADCMGIVLAEAMAFSLPIVATRVGGIPEAVEDGENGFIVDVDDAQALGERLERLTNSAELRLKMGRRSRQIGERAFDIQLNANRIADLLVDLGRRAPAGAG